ncbi:MAG: ATP-binding protein [Flavobacteriales bacterium]|jgi:two-component system phosphate regulon sensor histidine kinase PhoR|nr:ATP-binding protein [Flavobacteriales bacterium]
MKKIKTPKQFSLVVASILAVASVVISSLFQIVFDERIYVSRFFVVAVASFAISYGVVYFFLESLITSKIRLLYRVIHSNDSGYKEVDLSMGEDVLGEAEKEVMKWGKIKSEEIEKLKEQEEYRREFLGNLAHELKTPIFSIQGYILTLLEGGLEDEKMNRVFLERANKGVDRMTRLVEDLDMVTEIETGRIVLHQDSVDIVALVQDVLDSFEIKAKTKKVTLSLLSDFESKKVFCDKDKIEQVLINLINNSINYGNENGATKVKLFDAEDHVLIEIADDGIGISKEHLSRLFERFYRVDKSRARHAGGTGLGLSIVKHIIEAHQQKIGVRSEFGKGSVFHFSLKKV